ncbi:MAG: hypothetical protein HY909_09060 [Deltaproteobacteria bacterium]|nr:hypothetical protein [Deltaproteobacteria bacterium]
MLHLVTAAEPRPREEPYPFVGTALSVAFAAQDDLAAVASGTRLRLALAPPVAPEDGYLVLPLRARAGLVGALARGALGRLGTWFSDARVVRAELDVRPAPRLWIGACWRVTSRFEAAPDHTVRAEEPRETLEALRAVPSLTRLFPSGLLDLGGLALAVASDEYAGPARTAPGAEGASGFLWTVRARSEVTVRLALYADEEDDANLYASVMPLGLRLGG